MQGGWWRGAAERARIGHAAAWRGGEDDRGGGGLGRLLAAGPARPHREEAQVSFSSFSVF